MAIYALGQRSGETYDAAGKAISDVYHILGEFDAKVIWNMPKKCNKYLKILDIPYLTFFLLGKVGSNDYIFFSIPENGFKIKLIKKLQKIKKYQIVCFVNDINAFRYGNFEAEEVQTRMREEISLIGVADKVIAPNKNTIKLFEKFGIDSQMFPVGVWDYLVDEDTCHRIQENAEKKFDSKIKIAFAGNLNKSEFLWNLDENDNIEFELWGKLDTNRKPLPKQCHYHGVLPSEKVPEAISFCDYGLVWDGTGKNEIAGGLGEYLRYNNSHKCGLYLASQLPVIVWEESGMADFVRENQCGITIKNLQELSQKVGETGSFNKEMLEKIGTNIRKGTYLHSVFEKVFK